MDTKKALIGLWVFHAALAWAQPQLSKVYIDTPNARVEVLGEVHLGPVAVDASQTRIVAYAPEDVNLSGVTSVFVNGSYHTSLMKGAYSDLCLRPGSIEIGLRQVQDQRPKDRLDTTLVIRSAEGQTTYLRVREQSGDPVVDVVSADQALPELVGKRLQMHAISRAAQPCVQAPDSTPKVSSMAR